MLSRCPLLFLFSLSLYQLSFSTSIAVAAFTDDQDVRATTTTNLAFVTTYCAASTSLAAVHVLAESLLRAGHREGLHVIADSSTSEDKLSALSHLPLVRITRAQPLETYCLDGDGILGRDGCDHLGLLMFDPTLDLLGVSAAHKLVYISPHSVVLENLAKLSSVPAFSAVLSQHHDEYDPDNVLVLKRDSRVARLFRDASCEHSTGFETTMRDNIPHEIWSPLDDSYAVPADHMDTSWYKQDTVVPKIIRFDGAASDLPKPWNWWNRDTFAGVRMSLTANTYWCLIAAYTPYNCGWGRGSDDMHPVSTEAKSTPPNNIVPSAGDANTTPTPVPLLAPNEPSGVSTGSKFGVLLSTYQRNTWRQLVKHYGSMKAVSKVFLVWHDPNSDAPSARELGDKVCIMRAKYDSLNNRYVAPEKHGVNFPEALYVCDDDMWVAEKSLVHVFNVWRTNTRRLVGLFPRKWHNTAEVRYSAKISRGYNIVLTKGLFVHRSFLFMYQRLLPAYVKNVVDRTKNCEDILLNIMVSKYTNQPPIHVLVEDPILDLGHSGGISKRGRHFTVRRQCVDTIVKQLDISHWEPPLAIGSMSVRPLKNREIK